MLWQEAQPKQQMKTVPSGNTNCASFRLVFLVNMQGRTAYIEHSTSNKLCLVMLNSFQYRVESMLQL